MPRVKKKAIGIRIQGQADKILAAKSIVESRIDPIIREWERISKWQIHPCYEIQNFGGQSGVVLLVLFSEHLRPEFIREISRLAPFQIQRPQPKSRAIEILRHSRLIPFSALIQKKITARPICQESLNRLLRWVSSISQGSQSRFENACHALGIESSDFGRVRRNLCLLGHIEWHDSRWSVGVPTLVRLPGQDRFVWCGGRDEQLKARLKRQGQVIIESQANGPDVCYFEGSPETLDGCFHWETRGALRLAEYLPNLTSWRDLNLKRAGISGDEVVARFDFAKNNWDGPIFARSARQSGFYRVGNVAPYRYWFHENGKWYSGEFHGLRFLAFLRHQERCPIIHSGNRLLCPIRWPLLYEKALVLASGKLPQETDQGWVYENIDDLLLGYLKTALPLEIRSCTT